MSLTFMNISSSGMLGASNSAYGTFGSSFPHYKHVAMPEDQREKLLAMHEVSRANAGIYVAVVLAFYILSLTILFCRYGRRKRPSSSDSRSNTDTQPLAPQRSASASMRRQGSTTSSSYHLGRARKRSSKRRREEAGPEGEVQTDNTLTTPDNIISKAMKDLESVGIPEIAEEEEDEEEEPPVVVDVIPMVNLASSVISMPTTNADHPRNIIGPFSISRASRKPVHV